MVCIYSIYIQLTSYILQGNLNILYLHISYRHTYISINLDIDECRDIIDACSQTCTNSGGGITCGCNDGFLLDIDGVTCNGMQYKHVYRQLLTLTHIDGVKGYCNEVFCWSVLFINNKSAVVKTTT